jgi:hypothetical protein
VAKERQRAGNRWLAPAAVLATAAVIGSAAGTAAVLRGGSQSASGPVQAAAPTPPLLGSSRTLTLAKAVGDIALFVTARPRGPIELRAVTGEGNLPRQALRATVDGRGVEPGTCGSECYRIAKPVLQGAPTTIAVRISRAGKPARNAVVQLPARLPPSGNAVLTQARRVMHRLRTLRYRETLTAGLGGTVVGRFQVQAPDRVRIDSNFDEHIILIGKTRWTESKGEWTESVFPGTRQPAFAWDGAGRARVLDRPRIAGGRGWLLALSTAGPVPVWFQLLVAPNRYVHEMRMITRAHFMTQTYFGFNRPVSIEAPTQP